MNKKFTSTALAALMIAGTTSFSAFAAMSNGTVVIGTKAFDLAYANDPANATEISNAIVAGGLVYVKDFNGNWIDNISGLAINASVIPAVVYKNAAGVTTSFAAADKEGVATVTSIKATGSTKLTLTGTDLETVTAANITVADNTVKSATVNSTGTSVDVVLENSLIADEATAVTVNTKVYSVTYSLNAGTVAVKSAVYDNDTSKQYVAITVDGVETTIGDLEAAGYDAEFSARTAKTNGEDAAIFVGDDNTSTDGKLADNLNDYITKDGADETATNRAAYVQVTLTKGSDIMVSSLEKITIQNQDIVASSIVSAKLVNTSGISDFTQNSTKLVTGEAAYIKSIKVSVDGNDETILAGNFTVKSSKASVVYATSDGVLEAVAPGTATLTITYGNKTKTIAITVEKDEREITKVSLEKINTDTKITSLTAALDKDTAKVEVEVLDQYGDPMDQDTSPVFAKSSNEDVLTVADAVDGVITLNLLDIGSATVSFYDASGLNYKVPGTLSVKVVENGDVSKSVLDIYEPTDAEEVAIDPNGGFSDDATIDMTDDNYIVFNLNQSTSAGVSLGAVAVDDTVTVASSRADVLDDSYGNNDNGVLVSGDKIIVKAGTKTGTVTIKVVDPDTGISYTKKITVVDDGNAIKSVAFKTISDPTYSKTYKYSSAITTTDSGDLDPKVSGIVMEKAVSQSIRLVKEDGTLYIDKNADGEFVETEDTFIGTLTLTAVGDFANDVVSLEDGIKVESGDDGTIIFKVVDTDEKTIIDAVSFGVDF